jgi:hypothetical protein
MSKRPTGITAAVASLLVIVAAQIGLDLSAEEAAAVIGALSAVVSWFTPRVTE